MIRKILVGAAALTLACSTGISPKSSSILERVLAADQELALTQIAGSGGMPESDPNDPLMYDERGRWAKGAWGNSYENQWYLKEMHVDKAWQFTRGAGVRVAMMDTGIDGSHPDLAPNIEWDHGSATVGVEHFFGPEHDTDTHGFGTAMAGIIGAVQNNGIGISGIAPEVKIVPYRITHPDDAEVLDLGGLRGLAVANHIIARGDIDVVNLSGGLWNSPLAGTFCDIGKNAADAGVIVVVTAHNGKNNQGAAVDIMGSNPNNMATGMTPANCPHVITVSAYALGKRKARVGNGDRAKQRSSHSNFGAEVDIAAPGGDGAVNDPGPEFPQGKQILYGNNNILTLLAADPSGAMPYLMPVRDGLLGHLWANGTPKKDITDDVRVTGEMIGPNDGEYVRWRGSISTPMVTGVIALMLSASPELKALEGRERFEAVKQILELSAVGVKGSNDDLGAGRVDAFRAVRLASRFQ